MINWFRNLFQTRSLENPAIPLSSPAIGNYLGNPRSSSGISVDRISVLQYPAVWRALTLVSAKIGRLPVNVYKRNKSGGREIDYEHAASWLLSRKPSDLYTPITWKSATIFQALLHGNSFTWVIRDDNGKPQELVLLDPEKVGVMFKANQLQYFVRLGDNDTKIILPQNILHVKCPLSHDGILGHSALSCLRESFGLGLAAQRYGSVFFRNNCSPGPMIIKFPVEARLDKEQAAQFREQLEKTHGGLDNSHRPLLLTQGGDVTTFTADHDAMQFLQLREHEVACGIANIFGIPANKLGVKVNSSYGALDVDERAFLHDTIDPWLVAMEEELECKLLKESQQIRDSHFIEFDRRNLEQADYDKKSTTMLAQLNGGGITFNQWADAMNLPGNGAEGDRLRVPTTVTYLDLLGVDPEGEDGDDPVADAVLSGDPDQPAESPAAEIDGKSPVDGDPVDGQQPLRMLLSDVVKRWLLRVRKASVAASGREDWSEFLRSGIESHGGILCDSVRAVGGEVVAGKLLDLVRQELLEVTRDQVPQVFDRISAEEWAKEMLR